MSERTNDQPDDAIASLSPGLMNALSEQPSETLRALRLALLRNQAQVRAYRERCQAEDGDDV